MWKITIADADGNPPDVDITVGEVPGLVVATRPLKTFLNKVEFFQNDEYGIDLNQDASAGGTPEIVHDGADQIEWTATDIVGGGKTTFDNDDEHAHGGTVTIVNANNCAGIVHTLVVSGTTHTITEGGGADWALVAADNTATATALAAYIATLAKVSATSSGAVVTVTADSLMDITKLDSDDTTNGPATARAVKVDNSPVNDVFQFDKGSDLNCSGYVAISLWIYVDKDWKAGDSISLYGYDTGSVIQIGDSILLQDYFSFLTYKVWHKISIPLTDFGALSSSTTLDALRVRILAAEGKSPKFYLDDIRFEQTGTPVQFCIEPTNLTWLHVSSINIQMADTYSSIVANGTMPSLPYDSFLGLTGLGVGVIYQRVQDEDITNTASLKTLADLMLFSNASLSYGADNTGATTWFNVLITLTEPLILKAEDNDKICLTISEDFSELLRFRVTAGCKEEQRT